ncbi:GNAT family N-acetyltransferase, partial [Pseudomonas viridiflava]|uniref:GNAT family N-acetyltransferase n=1 Tax=Pseudomonas viridiflava TaxID=33069 RepID=UPI0019D13461
VRAAADHAFDVLRLHRVQAETLPENVGSQRALESAGFTRYGFAPEYIKINGVWRDHVMFQLLAPTPARDRGRRVPVVLARAVPAAPRRVRRRARRRRRAVPEHRARG